MDKDNLTISNLSTEQNNAPTSEEILANFEVCKRKMAKEKELIRCKELIISEIEKAFFNFQRETKISVSPCSYAIFDSSIYRKALEEVNMDEEKTNELCVKFSNDIATSMEQFVKSAVSELNKDYLETTQLELISCSGGECTGIEWDSELDRYRLIVSNCLFVLTF